MTSRCCSQPSDNDLNDMSVCGLGMSSRRETEFKRDKHVGVVMLGSTAIRRYHSRMTQRYLDTMDARIGLTRLEVLKTRAIGYISRGFGLVADHLLPISAVIFLSKRIRHGVTVLRKPSRERPSQEARTRESSSSRIFLMQSTS